MTTNPGTEKQPPTPVTDSSMSSKSIEVQPLPDEAPAEKIPVAPSEGGSDAPRKHKRRSGNSVDLTYRYDEPSDDELSWTEDEHGTRRRRKSKKTRGGGDDFKTGIIPTEGKKRRRRRRSGQSNQGDDHDDEYTGEESESGSNSENDEKKTRRSRKRSSGKSDDFKTGIVPREGKARKKKRSSVAPEGGEESDYSSERESDNDDGLDKQRRKAKKRVSGKSDDFKTGILHVEGRRRKKRKSAANGDESALEDNGVFEVETKQLPELGDGWTNVEWTILEHTHDHIRNLGEENPEDIDASKLAEAFLEIYETSEYRIKAEEEGKERKEFSKEEVRDRIIALRKTRDRRKSGELPPASKLGSPASVKSTDASGRRLSGFLKLAKFW